MTDTRRTPYRLAPVLLALALVSATAVAAPPEDKGGGRAKAQGKAARADVKIGAYFEDRQRTAATDYYGSQRAAGHCPPGLAKKRNGCQPPGQVKQWQKGKPLARTTVWYPVPPDLVVVLGSPPAGHRYVRVANDILLIAIGTGMVIDAIEDLMRL